MKMKCHIGLKKKKTLREKEELLVASNPSFSHNVFHSYISLVRQNAALCGNGLNGSTKRIDPSKHNTHRSAQACAG